MSNLDLETRFNEAVYQASLMTQATLPQDVQLRLYAYFKQANHGHNALMQHNDLDLRNAFKMNAWLQISHLSSDESKEMYIQVVEEILTNNKL